MPSRKKAPPVFEEVAAKQNVQSLCQYTEVFHRLLA